MNTAVQSNDLKPGLNLIIPALKDVEKKILKAAAKGLSASLLLIEGIAERDYMSGPAPGKLRKITGTLARSLNSRTEIKDGVVLGHLGNSAQYGAYHEFGFHGTQTVAAHTRVLANIAGNGHSLKRRELRDAAGNRLAYKETRKDVARRQKTGVAKFVHVKQHTRKVDYPGKPFLRPALKDARPLIISEIKAALQKLQPLSSSAAAKPQ